MVGLCTCNKHKLAHPLRSTHVFRWMCEGCKAKLRNQKRSNQEAFEKKLRLLREVMPTFSAENDNSAPIRKRRRG